jgi:hypothetical protein
VVQGIAWKIGKVAHMITIDSLSADYLFSKSIAEHKTPADIISEMIQERLVAAL